MSQPNVEAFTSDATRAGVVMYSDRFEDVQREGLFALKHYPVAERLRRTSAIDPDIMAKAAMKWVTAPQGLVQGKAKWLNFGLIYLGREAPGVAAALPHTMALLRQIEKDTGKPLWMVGYSWMSGGCSLGIHRDTVSTHAYPTVWHLGLDVPEGSNLYVQGKVFPEETGKWIQFDEGYKHSAENNSAKPRLLLYLSFCDKQDSAAGNCTR